MRCAPSDESYPDVVVEQLFAPSESDGKMIPYFMVRRKDVKPDGQTPTWIYGYGGYNIPALPWATDKVGGLDIARWGDAGWNLCDGYLTRRQRVWNRLA